MTLALSIPFFLPISSMTAINSRFMAHTSWLTLRPGTPCGPLKLHVPTRQGDLFKLNPNGFRIFFLLYLKCHSMLLNIDQGSHEPPLPLHRPAQLEVHRPPDQAPIVLRSP